MEITLEKSGLLITNSRPPMRYEIMKWQSKGFNVYYQPLLAVVSLPVESLKCTPQAIVLTSMNGAISLQDSDWDRRIPVYCIGSATVAAAKASGFKDCTSPNSKPYPSAINLVYWVKQNLKPSDGAIIHGGGEQLRHDVAEMLNNKGFETLRVVLYKTQAAGEFSPEIAIALKENAINNVEISSEQTLHTFVELCKKEEINHQKFELLLRSDYLKNVATNYGFKV